MVRQGRLTCCLFLCVLVAAALAPSLVRADGSTPAGVDQTHDTPETDRLTRLALRKSGQTAPEPAAEVEADPQPAPVAEPSPQPVGAGTVGFDERLPLGRASSDANGRGGTRSGEGALSSSWWLNTVTALGAVIGLILLLRLVYSKATGRACATGRSAAVQVLTRVAVAPRSHILLVQLGQRIVVLGESTNGLTRVALIEEPDEIACLLKAVAADRPESITRGFSHMLDRFNRQYVPDDQLTADRHDDPEHVTGRARDEVSGLLSRLRSLAGRAAG